MEAEEAMVGEEEEEEGITEGEVDQHDVDEWKKVKLVRENCWMLFIECRYIYTVYMCG